ncbi:MAG: ATP-grasp domain-containing protein [Planctomycetota bacterium]|jgi:hypothetical protein
MRVALVGMAVLSEPDPDEVPLLRGLREAGCEAEVIAWDSEGDPRHDPARFDVCLLRATWNYHLHPESFLAWVDRAAQCSVLRNTPEVIRWNMHKRYLLELGGAGMDAIPTACFERGSKPDLDRELAARGWGEVVIKPAVSGASWLTHRFGAGERERATAFLREMLPQRDMLVQPFVGGGEVAIVWIDGRVTHAVEKAPRLHGADERVTGRPELDDRHRRFAEEVVQVAGQPALYARVDAVERADGSLLLSELEMIEPSLFFDHAPSALERFVCAVGRLGVR